MKVGSTRPHQTIPVPIEVLGAAQQYVTPASASRLRRVGGGLINDTWLLGDPRDERGALLLQSLNTTVFEAPRLVMENIQRVSTHLEQTWRRRLPGRHARHHLRLVRTLAGAPWWVDAQGQWWRCYDYIGGSRSLDVIPNRSVAFAAGQAFGRFIADLADLADLADRAAAPLHQTLVDFHHTPVRLRALEGAANGDPCGRTAGVRTELAAIHAHSDFVDRFAARLTDAAMPQRVVHSDTKVDNLLFDRDSGEALCVVDLDTVMPGFLAHDFGDLVRNGLAGNRSGSGIDLSIFTGLSCGFITATAAILCDAERAVLADSGRIMALELAARFLTDHLLGDVYFKQAYAGQNLQRCQRQLALLAAMEAQRAAMEAIVSEVLDQQGRDVPA